MEQKESIYGLEAPHIETLKREVDVSDYMGSCVDVQKFIKYCEACKNHERIWSCPPFSFSAETLWCSYKTLLLYGKKIILPPSLTEKAFDEEVLKAQYRAILPPIKRGILFELLAMEKVWPESRALSAGSCEECEVCTRAGGLDCAKPEVMRHSIESLGGDVTRTLELYFNLPLLWAKEGRLPEHFILLGGLFKR